MKTATTEQRTAIRDLLSENKKALQFLHIAKGFDFEKDFYIVRMEGSFTANKVHKAIRAIIPGDYIAAIMLRANSERHTNRDLYYVSFCATGGGFDATRAKNLDYWKHDIDYMYGVGDFEETRKKKTDHIYIIAQSTENATTAGKKPVNMARRFKLKEAGKCYYKAGGDAHYIHRIELETTDGQKTKFTYEPWGSFYGNEKRSDDICDYIDKNGYLLRARRLDLHGRAMELRAKREKAALNVYDFSNDEKAARAGLEKCKTFIAEKIAAVKNYEDAKNVDYLAGRLRYLMIDFDQLGKEFRTINGKKSVYESINKTINGILEGCEQ